MSKDTIISKINSLSDGEQREILHMLQDRFGADIELSDAQTSELDRRLENFEKNGSRGDKWEVVYKRLLKARSHARRSH